MKSALTEVSVSFTVTEQLNISVQDEILFLVDTRHNNVIRMIHKEQSVIPDWMIDPKENTVRFIYNFTITNVECMYRPTKNMLILYKIKYEHFELFKQTLLQKFLNKFNISNSTIMDIRFKAIGELSISKPWCKMILADIITLNPAIFNYMVLKEKACTVLNSRLFSASVKIPSQENMIGITLTVKNTIIVTMSKLASETVVDEIMKFIQTLLNIYEHNFDQLFTEYCEFINNDDIQYMGMEEHINGIKYLRSRVPELFINNYTRECPILPIIVDKDNVEEMQKTQRVIMYPLTGPYRQYYTAPDGYYIGLKPNRLKNADVFPYLVTCYISDHMNRKSSVTYKYYVNENEKHRHRSNIQIPRSLIGQKTNYSRKKPNDSSFVHALEMALNLKIDVENLPYCPQLVKQELWDLSDEQIMNIIKGKNNYGLNIGSCVYRYFEELLKISIHVIPIDNGQMTTLVSRHKNVYIWEPAYNKHIVIFENVRNIYGQFVYTYDVLSKCNKEMIFDSNDRTIQIILSKKKAESVVPTCIPDTSEYQVIDEIGKCRQIKTTTGELIDIYTRPMQLKVLPKPISFIEKHITKMNFAKEQLSYPTIDLTKHSTYRVRYFPNDISFQKWYKNGNHTISRSVDS